MAKKVPKLPYRDVVFRLSGETLRNYEFLEECFFEEEDMKQAILESGLQTLEFFLFEDEDATDN